MKGAGRALTVWVSTGAVTLVVYHRGRGPCVGRPARPRKHKTSSAPYGVHLGHRAVKMIAALIEQLTRRLFFRDDLVDNTVLLGLFWRHKVITVGISLDGF